MTRLISAVMVVTLLLSVAPVLAGHAFHALSRLPATAPAAITGGARWRGGANIAVVRQLNLAIAIISLAGGEDSTSAEAHITQANVATIAQALIAAASASDNVGRSRA